MKVVKLFLTFDCEDFINPLSINALNYALELLKKYDFRAIFFLTGSLCENLRSFPNIIDLLKEHEIGYHSSSHSVHPAIFEYTDIADYEEASRISLDHETKRINPFTGEPEGRGGFLLLRDLFPRNRIVAFRAPGFCWSPPHMVALERLGIEFDFSTDISEVPIHYGQITFYPLAEGGFSLMLMGRSLFRSFLRIREEFFCPHSQYSLLLFHPESLVNKVFWDAIYYDGNPRRLSRAPAKSADEVAYSLRKFDLFLNRARFLKRDGVLEVTPPLQKGMVKKHFTNAEIIRSYRRSLQWAEKHFAYRPKFLLKHFFRYFKAES
jgi:hypothetical protein